MRSNFPPEEGRLTDSSFTDCGFFPSVETSIDEAFRLGGTTFRSGSKIAATGTGAGVAAGGNVVDANSVALSVGFADADPFSLDIVAPAALITSFRSSCLPFGFLLFCWLFD